MESFSKDFYCLLSIRVISNFLSFSVFCVVLCSFGKWASIFKWNFLCANIILTLKIYKEGGMESRHQGFLAITASFFIQINHTWSQMKAESFSTSRAFEDHPRLYSFAVRGCWSSLVWLRKFASFWCNNFWKFFIFELQWQYVYQMKAEIILNSYFTTKNTICYEKISVKWILHNFHLNLGDFFLKLKCFENFDTLHSFTRQ